MSDLVGNPEDRFSHNEAHLPRDEAQIADNQIFRVFLQNANMTCILPFLFSVLDVLSEFLDQPSTIRPL